MKRTYGKTRDEVLLAFNRHPNWTSSQIGELLELHPAYVRKTLKRNGKQLARPRGHRYLPQAEAAE